MHHTWSVHPSSYWHVHVQLCMETVGLDLMVCEFSWKHFRVYNPLK